MTTIPPLTAVLLAGGEGKRLWPLSTREHPKQFLPLAHHETLLQRAYKLLEFFISPEYIYVISHERYKTLVLGSLPRLPSENLICEPAERNTAACITLSAHHVQTRHPESLMLCYAVDNILEGNNAPMLFKECVLKGAEYLTGNPEKLLCFGTPAITPETGLGYIRHTPFQNGFATISGFIEKPCRKKAEELIKEQNICWNSGIFLWYPHSYLQELSLYASSLAKQAEAFMKKKNNTKESYEKLPALSVDRAVLTQSRNTAVTMLPVPWLDAGSFPALCNLMGKDGAGNVTDTKTTIIDGRNNLILSTEKKKTINIVGLEELIVVETEKDILIVKKSDAQNVKKLVHYKEARNKDATKQ